ncbi:LANO_0F07118g1_1 [Lachancea nothofagi CBS 11611]|uniref:LANO_0F07118g1_1 n=1 Tax=Lachancea nothofagi CBS 11611 TaxID=1266666 RepID=A0A1G4K8T6_9SACH|nr:LANO_0F07118g1_1 [Lachancea nothofagi CBS 11611]
MSAEDEILKMFFDDKFVPLAYLDLLLSPNGLPLSNLQSVSSSLLSRLDLYTDRLTGELESTIQRLRRPTELLSYKNAHFQGEGTTKLQYYLDTLSTSVKDLKENIARVNTQVEDIKLNSRESTKTAETLRDLNLIKARLTQVSKCFEDLRSIVIASFEGIGEDEIPQTVSLSDFKASLKVLGDLLCSEFIRSQATESARTRNDELLNRVQNLAELRPAFRSLTKFSLAYDEFVSRIRNEAETYIQKKDMDPTFV